MDAKNPHEHPQVELLRRHIERRQYTVGVIGLGYVGLPLVLRFAEAGFPVLGFDVDPHQVDRLNAGRSYIREIGSDRIGALVRAGRLEATADFEGLGKPDALIICVPTPLTPHREPDLQYVERTAEAVAATLRAGQLVCLESTTYPGTTEEVVLPRLARRGLTVGRDFFLAYSPEREDPGNASYTTATIPKLVGGVTPGFAAAYKKDTDDPRESPALEILSMLSARGAKASYSDPHLPVLPNTRRHNLGLASVTLDAATVGQCDAVLLVTDHSDFDYATVFAHAPLIVDTRNAFARRGLVGPHVERA